MVSKICFCAAGVNGLFKLKILKISWDSIWDSEVVLTDWLRRNENSQYCVFRNLKTSLGPEFYARNKR
jgi:hypothetical protein